MPISINSGKFTEWIDLQNFMSDLFPYDTRKDQTVYYFYHRIGPPDTIHYQGSTILEFNKDDLLYGFDGQDIWTIINKNMSSNQILDFMTRVTQ